MNIKSIKTIEDIKDLEYYYEYQACKDYEECLQEAINFFKEFYKQSDIRLDEDLVKQGQSTTITHYDENRNMDIYIKIYEFYIDSGSVDYFYASYESLI